VVNTMSPCFALLTVANSRQIPLQVSSGQLGDHHLEFVMLAAPVLTDRDTAAGHRLWSMTPCGMLLPNGFHSSPAKPAGANEHSGCLAVRPSVRSGGQS